MHTSYEQRLEFLQQFSDGLEIFSGNNVDAKIAQGDGWRICSSNSQFAMLNNAVLNSSRKESLDELIAAIEANQAPAGIRLAGPAIVHTTALAELGYTNHGGAPFMLWSADTSVDGFKLREGLSVRRLVPSDSEVMNTIYADVYSMSPEMITDYKTVQFSSEEDHTYGLFKDSEMVSLVTALVYKDTVGIWNMGTPTIHQKNGYGSELLKYVMKAHKDMGGKNFFLHATSAGKFLYDKCGWITLDYLPYLSKVVKK
ncbi:MAG: GNAT family N-acetyltransferase [Actinomycetes bacterium]